MDVEFCFDTLTIEDWALFCRLADDIRAERAIENIPALVIVMQRYTNAEIGKAHYTQFWPIALQFTQQLGDKLAER
jgi:hypothetical protein